eukprot:Transcript_6454.p2 GENE.Transcript_6454~~Transcript_6454.p2  ORF type:complete len:348 (-),score=97.39 Transcript_6454:18-1061(-)
MRVVVFGGSGFIGRHCVEALREAGHQVTAPSHKECDLSDGGTSGNNNPMRNSKRHAWELQDAMLAIDGAVRGADLVVNTVGIKRATAAQSWEAVHIGSVKNLVAGMERNGVRRLVHITVAGLADEQSDPYSVTKRASEAVIASSDEISAVILRPGVVWGRGDDFSRNLAAGILHAPLFPTPSPAGTLAVVHVADVAAAVVAAVKQLRAAPRHGAGCACTDVVGPAALSLPELQKITAEALGLSCVALPVPAPLMVPAAALVERLMADPPITRAQLGLLRRGVRGDLEQTRAMLAREPRPYTAEGVQAAVSGLAKPLFGVSVRPVLRTEVALAVLVLLIAVLLCYLFF